ncbi:MAG: hypothetical protein ACLFQ6_12735, partial [Candidatus Sumerlaeia bacterium]
PAVLFLTTKHTKYNEKPETAGPHIFACRSAPHSVSCKKARRIIAWKRESFSPTQAGPPVVLLAGFLLSSIFLVEPFRLNRLLADTGFIGDCYSCGWRLLYVDSEKGL